MLINTPNNPSGVVYSKETLERLAQVLAEKSKELGHDIFLISDEPYREILFEGESYPCPCTFYDNSMMCYSFSKSLSVPGERIGYLAVNPACQGSGDLVNMCGQISRGIGHNCPPSLFQLAVGRPGGTFYIFPKALEEDAKEFCQKALKYDLILVPGDTFGAPGYFRMAYCIETEKVERSLEALRKFVREEYGR